MVEFEKKYEEYKRKVEELKSRGELKGFLHKKGVYIGYKEESSEEFILIYKCPYCKSVVETRIKVNYNSKPAIVIVCEKCGKEIDRIDSIPGKKRGRRKKS